MTEAGAFRVTPTYKDFLAANRLAARASWRTRRMAALHALVVGLVLLMIVGEDMGRRGFSASGLGQDLFTSALFLALIYAAIFALGRLMIDSRARGAWSVEKREGLETRYRFDTAGFTLENAMENHAHRWADLTAVLEDRRNLLLLPTPATFHAIPKAQLAPEVLHRLHCAISAANLRSRL